jgi:hypothetical protein
MKRRRLPWTRSTIRVSIAANAPAAAAAAMRVGLLRRRAAAGGEGGHRLNRGGGEGRGWVRFEGDFFFFWCCVGIFDFFGLGIRTNGSEFGLAPVRVGVSECGV